MQRPNIETETPEHKILNSAPVTTNEALNSTCKYSVNHAPSHTSHRKGSNLENQHTRMTLGTLSWVYKPSDYLMVILPGSPCWSTIRKTYSQLKPRGIETHIPPPRCDSFDDCFGKVVLTLDSVTTTS